MMVQKYGQCSITLFEIVITKVNQIQIFNSRKISPSGFDISFVSKMERLSYEFFNRELEPWKL